MGRTLSALALGTGGLVAVSVVGVPAASASGSCTTSSGTTACTFSETGGSQTWTVPADVDTATFDVYGAQGGGLNAHGATGTGAKGGETTYTAPVVPGDTYEIVVGGAGTYGVAGFNGGGPGGPGAGGGGGGSDVWFCATSGCANTSLFLEAGGGGGSEGSGLAGGAGGGTTGGIGSKRTTPGTGTPGHGGTQAKGGAGGLAGTGGTGTGATGGAPGTGTTSPALPGTGGAGGTGATYSSGFGSSGGGGGGGFYGGGGGGGDDSPTSNMYFDGGGGGGGSGYGPPGASLLSGIEKGNGEVVISYTPLVAPTITSTDHTTFTVGSAGTFQATASGLPDPTFSETGALPGGVTLSTAGVLAGTPAAGSGGTYAVTIKATNGVSPAATQSFTLTVDQAPAITSVDHATFVVGTAGTFQATASGFPTATFTEPGALPGGVTLSTAGVLSGTPAAGSGGTYPVTMKATNGVSPAATQSFTLTVDQAPAITSVDHATFVVGTAGTFQATASGFPAPPTFSETGTVPGGVTLSTAGVLAGTPVADSGGTYPVTIKATNGISPAATQSFTLTVDQAPAITSVDHATFVVGTAGTFQATASGFPTATFTETGTLPGGVTLSTAGVLAGTPAAGSGGTYPVTIKATNGVSPAATQSFTLTVDQAPAISSVDHGTFVVGTAGTFQATASGFPAPTFTETGALPTGVHLSTAGEISGTPGTGAAGTYPVTIKATNGTGPPATQSFTLTVDQAPAITSADHATFSVETPGSFRVTGTGTPAPTFTETGALPSGVTLASTGVLSGTPVTGTAGIYPITIQASNGISPVASQSFTLTVNAPASSVSATRVAGKTAAATAAASFEDAFPSTKCPGSAGSRSVVLATDADFEDALASGYLAKSLDTGILLTAPDALPQATLDALRHEGVTHVDVVGGPLAVATAVVAALEALPAYTCGGGGTTGTNLTVSRIGGTTAEATATLIAETVPSSFDGSFDLSAAYRVTNAAGGTGLYNTTAGKGSAAPTAPADLRTAILATVATFPDAESSSVLSYADDLPILLTTPTTLSPEAASAISRLQVTQVVVMGGPLAIATAVVAQLESAGVSVLRVGGRDATTTAIQLSDLETASASGDLGFGWGTRHMSGVFVARGTGFTDGLAGAPLAAADGPEPLLLTESPTSVGTYLTQFLHTAGRTGVDDDGTAVDHFTVLGGSLAVTTGVMRQMEADLSG